MADSIGKRLYEIRTELQYSQERVAKEIGVSRNTFSDAELGKKPLNDRQINLFCNTFGINKDYFLHGTQPKYKLEPKDKKALELFKKLHPALQDSVLIILESMLKAEKDIEEKL